MTSKSLCAPLRGTVSSQSLIQPYLVPIVAPFICTLTATNVRVHTYSSYEQIELEKSIAIIIVPDDIDVPKCESNIAIASEVIIDGNNDANDIVTDQIVDDTSICVDNDMVHTQLNDLATLDAHDMFTSYVDPYNPIIHVECSKFVLLRTYSSSVIGMIG